MSDRIVGCGVTVICALDSAMRTGEIFKMPWQDVDFAKGEIYIPQTNKSGYSRFYLRSFKLDEGVGVGIVHLLYAEKSVLCATQQ